ncbi:hypothetical protein [Kribbella sp. CA-293567]|uniref:hypothetical protein n=1 Tax=Kribbella sp. CA-293567 TaxID=3002436 RepID=UPI0022DDE1A6|nr:hypothetical protein [Kribbella sp. CA-293567]WBQ02935.1 hypothetical protein OX958_23480 [Kribbella sp. CA-293567]
MLALLDDYAGWIVGVLGGLTALGVVARWVRKRVQTFAQKWDRARETLVGREEIRHPDTAVVLVQATPGLGQRLAHIEQNLTALSDTRTEMQTLTQRVGDLTGRFDQHVTESQELDLARAREQSKMWDTIKTIAEAPSAHWDGVERRGTEL